MIYISSFTFPNADQEHSFFMKNQHTCFDTFYPFQVLSARGLTKLDFEPLTVLYGGNGSGKTTALNIMAEKLQLQRDSNYNKSNFYPDYIKMCRMDLESEIPKNSRMITSDDVFDQMLDIRSLNDGIDQKRETLFAEYLDVKYSDFQMQSLADYDQLKKVNKSRSKTQSRYIRSELMNNVREYSNGESAYRYFTEKIGENGLYLLDEPENSLSAQRQIELTSFMEDSVRFFGCQFVISTHSPFMLAMKGAKIYDLDEKPVGVKNWTELTNIRLYYDFFQAHRSAFEY